MCKNICRLAKTGSVQHCRPEQSVEIQDIFANEIVDLGLRVVFPVGVKINIFALAQILETGNVANGCIQPDVEVFVYFFRNLKSEIWCIA